MQYTKKELTNARREQVAETFNIPYTKADLISTHNDNVARLNRLKKNRKRNKLARQTRKKQR